MALEKSWVRGGHFEMTVRLQGPDPWMMKHSWWWSSVVPVLIIRGIASNCSLSDFFFDDFPFTFLMFNSHAQYLKDLQLGIGPHLLYT